MALGYKMGASGKGGAKIYLDGELMSPQPKQLSLVSNDAPFINFPYQFYDGELVSMEDGCLHVIGTGGIMGMTVTGKEHYKWNGSVWNSVSELPSKTFDSTVINYNGNIHILGIQNNYVHHKWNGSVWNTLNNLPYQFGDTGGAVVYNNKLHILGGYYGEQAHYIWNESTDTWTSASTLPVGFKFCKAVVYNNEIHIFGGNNTAGYQLHYKWNGNSWTNVSTLPYRFYGGNALVCNNEINIIGASGLSGLTAEEMRAHYKLNGTSWVSVSTLPHNFGGSATAVYDNEIHLLGDSYNNPHHHKFINGEWKLCPPLNMSVVGMD